MAAIAGLPLFIEHEYTAPEEPLHGDDGMGAAGTAAAARHGVEQSGGGIHRQGKGLRDHEHAQTGEKPFACSTCSYRTSHASHLRVHERTHTGEKPFACSMCEFRTSNAGNLRRHGRTHGK